MKTKTGLSAIVLLLCLFLSSCGKQQMPSVASIASEPPEEYTHSINSTDCDRAFSYAYKGYAVCSSEDAIYFSVQHPRSNISWIWFSDKQTGFSMPLCGKADCSHNNSTCNAYCQGRMRCLSAYDGKLFWLETKSYGDFKLYSCNPDGTGRTEYPIENNELYQSLTDDRKAFIHRGYVYFYGQQSVVDDGDPRLESSLIRCPVTGGTPEMIFHEPAGNAMMVVQAYGDQLFIVCSKHLSFEEKEIVISRIDCATLEKTCLYSEVQTFMVNNLWVTDSGILLSGNDSNKLYGFDNSSQTITVPFVMDSDKVFERQLYFGENHIVATRRSKDSFGLMVRDFAGNYQLIESYELEISKRMQDQYFAWVQGVDNDSVYIYFNDAYTYTDSRSSLIRFPLDGSEPVVLWSEN